MTELHCRHLQSDIDQYVKSVVSTTEKVVDKSLLKQEKVDKWPIKPTLAGKLADILAFVADKEEITTEAVVQHFGFTATSAKHFKPEPFLLSFVSFASSGGRAFMSANSANPTRQKKTAPRKGNRPWSWLTR